MGDSGRHASALAALLTAASALAQAPVPEAPGGTHAANAGSDPGPALEERLADVERRAQAAEQRAAEAEQRAARAEAAAGNAATQVQTPERRVEVYGFADMGFRKFWLDRDSRFENLIPEQPQFLFGNVNFYFDAQPSDQLRALTELRLTLYPGGTPDPVTFQNQRTSILDTNSPTGRNRVTWSGVVLERAQLEWHHSDAFAVVVGYFLTPYGIWNVDHGTPVLISSLLPEFFASEYFPTHQLGVQALGSLHLGGEKELGWRAYVTNGRSPVQGDIDDAKNVGGRLFLSLPGEESQVVLGTSAYLGTYREVRLTPTQITPYLLLEAETIVDAKEWGLGADLALDLGRFRSRLEWVGHHLSFADGKRPSRAPGIYQADELRWNAYGVFAYRLPWAGLEPYVYVEYARRLDVTSTGFSITSGGLNVHFEPALQLKLQFARVLFYAPGRGIDTGFSAADARLVMVY